MNIASESRRAVLEILSTSGQPDLGHDDLVGYLVLHVAAKLDMNIATFCVFEPYIREDVLCFLASR